MARKPYPDRTGFVAHARKLATSRDPFWCEYPLHRREAWMDLLGMANYDDDKPVDGLKRGEFMVVERELAARWGWSKMKPRRFLQALVRRGTLRGTLRGTQCGTYVVVNYETYNPVRGTLRGTKRGTPRGSLDILEPVKPVKPELQLHDASGNGPDPFDAFWSAYPKRGGSNPKKLARERFTARVHRDRIDAALLIDKATIYARFCDATGKTGTEYVMQASSWLGTREGWLEQWEVPPEPLTREEQSLFDRMQDGQT